MKWSFNYLTKAAGLPKNWNLLWNWKQHVSDTLPFVFPVFAQGNPDSYINSGPEVEVWDNRKGFFENPLHQAPIIGTAKNAIYLMQLTYLPPRSHTNVGSTGDKEGHRIFVVRKCPDKNEHKVIAEAVVIGQIFEALEKMKLAVDSDAGCVSDEQPLPEHDPVPQEHVPTRGPSLVHACSNCHRKTASNLHGIIRYLKHEHVDLMEQDTTFTCGPASIQNLFRLLHIEMPAEENIAEVMGCDQDSGTDPKAIVWYLKRKRIPFRVYRRGADNLDQLLASNHVLLVEYQDYKEGYTKQEVRQDEASHFAVLVGFDAQSYFVIDPYHPKEADVNSPLKRIDKRRFHENWVARSYDGLHLMKNWGLIVRVPLK